MTAEVALLNKRGIVLAADSAVTIGGAKVMTNANKLFTLDSPHFIGLMVYGNADLGSVPWEIIFKTYRKNIGSKIFDSLSEYCDNLIEYINQANFLKQSRDDILLVNKYVQSYFSEIDRKLEQFPMNPSTEFSDKFNTILQNYFIKLIEEPLSKVGYDKSYFSDKTLNYINGLLDDQYPLLDDTAKELFMKVVFNGLNSQDYYSNQVTGLVVAGYGELDVFPGIRVYNVDGFYQDKLKFSIAKDYMISDEPGETIAAMETFAQSDVINNLVSGIDDGVDYFRHLQFDSLKNEVKKHVADDKNSEIEELFVQTEKAFYNHIQTNYRNPTYMMIDSLSLEEIANMAETFVSVTGFKRKYSNNLESVGGPTDVLIISRGDGPVWFKRKLYFDPQTNPGYITRRK